MIRTEKRLRLCKVLIAAVLVFIWGNSLLPGEISQAFSDWVKGILAMFAQQDGPETSGGLLRKIAHFTEFAALGLLLGWLAGMLQKRKVLPFGWGVLTACVDETIQYFTPGRCPALKDVTIDSCGVLTGLILLWIGHTLVKKRSTK